MKKIVFALPILILATIGLHLSLQSDRDKAPLDPESKSVTNNPPQLVPVASAPTTTSDAPEQASATALRRAVPQLSALQLLKQGRADHANSGKSGDVFLFASSPLSPHRLIRVESEPLTSSARTRYHLMVANRIVLYSDIETSESKATELARRINGKLIQINSSANAYLIEFENYQDLSRLPDLVSSLPTTESWIAFAEPDYLYTMGRVPNDPDYPLQKGMDSPSANTYNVVTAINASKGWGKRISAASQVVAVIDSGIQLSNKDLRENLWANPREKVDGVDNDKNGYVDDIHGIDLVDKDGNPNDIDGHGTAVAGLIGARGDNQYAIAGVAWQIQLMPIRIFDEDGFAAASDAAAAIDYAIENGAKIINASWGGESDSLLLKQAIAQANSVGALFVAAAGNESQDLGYSPHYPAAYDLPNILSVAATSPFGYLASFSNYNSDRVHIAAPGENILSLSIHPGKPTKKFSGTSFAAPLVTGIAALAREEFGVETPEQLKRRILVSARVYEQRRIQGVLTQGHADLDRVLHEKKSSPPNDLRENAITLTLFDNRHSGNSALASTEVDEPLPDNTQVWSTVWYTLEPAFNQSFEVNFSELPSDAAVHFYTGESLAPLTPLFVDSPHRYKLPHEIEETLFIQVSTTRPAWFNVALEAAPQNDDFANATLITSEPFKKRANNRKATLEDLESPRLGYNSVWWTFVAPEDGPLQISTQDSSFDTLLGVYSGSDLGSLVNLISNDDANLQSTHSELVLDVEKDKVYHIRVSGKYSDPEYVQLSGRILRKPLFVESPSDVTLPPGATASLQGRAIGPKPITYHWLFNGEAIDGKTTNRLVLENIDASHVGQYTLVANTPVGQSSSRPAQLALTDKAPQFIVHPKSGDYPLATRVTLTAYTKAPSNTAYQWFKNDEPIPGATSTSLLLENGRSTDSATYHLLATNANGSAQSEPAQLAFGNESDFLWRPAFDDEYERSIVGIANIQGQATWFAAWYSRLWQSTDGFRWKEVNLQIDGGSTGSGNFSQINKVMYGNGRYIVAFDTVWAVGSSLENLVMVSSPNFRNRIEMYNGAFLKGYFYAWQDNELVRSRDGIIWESQPAEIFRPRDIVANDSQSAFAVIQSDKFRFSTDMVNWSTHSLPESTAWSTPLFYDGKRFVVVLRDDKIFSTTNGQEWTKHVALPSGQTSVQAATYSDGTYIVVRGDGFLTSTDLTNWNLTSFESYHVESLHTADGIVIADSLSRGPTRILSSTQSSSTPPAIVPLDFKPYHRVTPGATLRFSVEAIKTELPIDRVEFHQNGTPIATLRQTPYTFDWLASQKGNHSIEAIAFDTEGQASRIGSTITVIANQIETAAPLGELERIQSILEAFGSTYAIDYSSKLYRFREDATWEVAHSFPENSIRKAFVFRAKLYVAAGPHLYRSDDGISWQVVLSHIGDSYIHSTASWLFVSDSYQSVLHAQFSIDGDNWIQSEVEDAYIFAPLNDTLVCNIGYNFNKVGLLAPGQEIRLVDLPPNTRIDEFSTDGTWFYFSHHDYNGEYSGDQNDHYRTRDFETWEQLPNIPSRRLDYADGLYLGGGQFLSNDLDNWIKTDFWFDHAISAEDAYLATSSGSILRSESGSDWTTVLDGQATQLAKTNAGYFAWSPNYNAPGLYFSPDGIEWITQLEEYAADYEYYTDITYGNGRYVVVGEKQATSTDGSNWIRTEEDTGLGHTIAFGNGLFLATTNLSGQGIASSPDGLNWTFHQTSFSPNQDLKLVYLSQAKAFFLYHENTKKLLKSTNGETWTNVTNKSIREAYLFDNYICIRKQDTHALEFTTDGRIWTETDRIAEFYVHGYYYSGNYLSSDAISWKTFEMFDRFSSSGSRIPLPDGTLLVQSRTQVDGLELYYKTRDGHFEGWVLADIDSNQSPPRYLNGINFLIENEIRLISTNDLLLESLQILSPTQNLAIGETIHLRLKVANQGLLALPLGQVAVAFRLANQENWHEEPSLSLFHPSLPATTLQPSQSTDVDIFLEIPNGTQPGSYYLVAQINPDQKISEYTRENNFARGQEKQITILQGSLSLNVVGSGQVIANPARDQYALGDTVFLSAVPNPRSRLKSVTGTGIQRQNLYAVTIQQQTKATFEFEEARYTATPLSNAFGTIEITPQKETYLEGEYITAKAKPNSNATFVRWLSGTESEEPEITFPIRSNIELAALFGQTFQQWTEDSFTEEQRQNPTFSDRNSDPDQDKLTNFLEYLTGQNPTDGNSIQPVLWTYAGDNLTVQFRYSQRAADYRTVFEFSTDGVNWIPAPNVTQTTNSLEAQVSGSTTIYLPDYQSAFLRLTSTPVLQPSQD